MAKRKSVEPKYIGYSWTDDMIRFVVEHRKDGYTFSEIADLFNEIFEDQITKPKTPETIRMQFKKYADFNFSDDEMLKNIKSVHNVKKQKSKVAKENRLLLDHIHNQEELLDSIQDMLKTNKIGKVKVPKVRKSKKKTDLGMELLVSDVHVGLKTASYDLGVCERRIEKYTQTALEEIMRLGKNYNVTKIQLNLAGDHIQGEHLHGSDSQATCELTDPEQVVECVRIYFYKLILPLIQTGIQVDILGMTGNHDRQGKDRPIHNAGKRYLTWTIYNTLKMMTEIAGIKNISWEIPVKEYASFDMFGHDFIVEHGHAKGISNTIVALEKQLLKRANQLGIIAKGIRIGHFHSALSSNHGRHIVNPSPVSDDCYGDHLGYVSYPAMIINYYVDTKKRDTSFYYTFEVNLSEVK